MPTLFPRLAAVRPLFAACLLAWTAAPLLTGCATDELTPTQRKLGVSTTEVFFPRTFVGYPTEHEIRVINASRADDSFVVEKVEAPFLVQPTGVVKIRGSSNVDLRIVFDPPAVGDYAAQLVLRFGEEAVFVALRGTAERPIPCPSQPCAPAQFNPRTGTCDVERLADGSPCTPADLCLVDATCQGGVCKGSPRVCEPPHMCAVAFCSPDIGCDFREHDDCPQPANPCRMARCDPELGCIEVDRDDYTPCGPTNCKELNVCIRGKCERRTDVPDGHPCLHACGPGGTCKGGTCQRPGGNVLQTAWELPDASATEIAVDELGYLYWLECGTAGDCTLASYTPNGFPRHRVVVMPKAEGLLVEDGAVFVWTATTLESLGSGGEGRWMRTLAEWGEVDPDGEILGVIGAGQGRLAARVRWGGSEGVVAVSAHDGTALWRRSFDGANGLGIASDGLGRVFVADPGGAVPMLRALDPQGGEAWAIEVPEEPAILAVIPSHVFLSAGGKLEARSAVSGNLLWDREHLPKDVVVSQEWAFVLEEGPAGPRLVVLHLADGNPGGPAYDLQDAQALSTLALRSEDGAILLGLRGEPVASWWLDEYDAAGARSAACTIPETSIAGSWAFLPATGGDEPRLVVRTEAGRIRTFIAPRLGSPPFGWKAEKGSFARGGRPR